MTERTLPDYITEQADGSLVVELVRGIEVDGAHVAALTLREPTVADQLAAQKVKGTSGDQELVLVANLAELKPADLQGMTFKDYRRLQEGLSAFLD